MIINLGDKDLLGVFTIKGRKYKIKCTFYGTLHEYSRYILKTEDGEIKHMDYGLLSDFFLEGEGFKFEDYLEFVEVYNKRVLPFNSGV